MPTSLGHLLGDASIQGGQAAIDEEEEKKQAAAMEGIHQTEREARSKLKSRFEAMTFMEAIEDLHLPKPEAVPKG